MSTQGNIIKAVFNGGYETNAQRADGKPFYQYDYGKILEITGLNLPAVVEIHFKHEKLEGPAITRIGSTVDGVTTTYFPRDVLKESGAVVTYIYVSDIEHGSTEYKIFTRITERAAVQEFDAPEDCEMFHETIEVVNEATRRSEEAALLSDASAIRSEEAATESEESAVDAEESKEQAAVILEDVRELKQQVESIEFDAAQVAADKAEVERLAEQVAADEEQTAEDRIQTGLDRQATAQDRVQTGLDRIATSADRQATEQAMELTEGYKDSAQASDTSAKQQVILATDQADRAKVEADRAESEADDAEESSTEANTSKVQSQQALSDLIAMLGTDIATLTGGKLTPSQIPPLSINDVFEVSNVEELLTLTAERGDVGLVLEDDVVTDSYLLAADDPTVLDNWKSLGVSYVANAGHANTADNATNSEKINDKRIIAMTENQYWNSAKDPDTIYVVVPDEE